MKPTFIPLLLASILASTATASAQDIPPAARHIQEFGKTDNPANAQAAWDAAREAMAKEPGILIVPGEIWNWLKPDSLQSLQRIPEPPAPAKTWRNNPGLTVLTSDRDRQVLHVPPLSGLNIQREFRLDAGDSAPHWGTHPMLTLDSKIVHGSSSYLDWVQAPAAKGEESRVYVPTIRGIWPGQFLNLHGGKGYGGGVTRAYVQSIGYDMERKQHYFTTSTELDHIPGAITHNKSNTGILHMTQTSHADNQTYDVKVIRNQYAHGDTYIYYCDFNYMSNVHSAAGDENGNCYAAFVRTLDKNFAGTVESMDWETSSLKFKSGANTGSLGNSRPLVNLNPEKHLTAGKVLIVTGRSEFDLPDGAKAIYQGKDYSTGLVKNPVTGSTERSFGGLIRGDKDCPWTEDVVGRYFAVNEPSEKTPKGDWRWYLITKFVANPDGTKDIEIERFWWGAKSAGSPTLYRPENYTWDGHEHPLAYIIAPGAYVNDVSRAIPGGDRGNLNTLGLAPHSAQGTKFDFEPGDRVEQAIGPDPFKPQIFRTWLWEDVPGQFPASVLEAANYGAVSRYAVIHARGGPANLDDLEKRHEPKPAWDNLLVQDSAVTVGLNFKADFARAAILFHQPNREQPIQWFYGQETQEDGQSGKSGITATVSAPAQSPKVASLEVSRKTGEFTFQGGGLQTGGPVSGVAGISGDAKPARNLRGKNLPVPKGRTEFQVQFPQPEADGEYAVFVEQTWLTNRAIAAKTADGFTIKFADPAPAGATLDWMLVR